jgi:hypothetical protein
MGPGGDGGVAMGAPPSGIAPHPSPIPTIPLAVLRAGRRRPLLAHAPASTPIQPQPRKHPHAQPLPLPNPTAFSPPPTHCPGSNLGGSDDRFAPPSTGGSQVDNYRHLRTHGILVGWLAITVGRRMGRLPAIPACAPQTHPCTHAHAFVRMRTHAEIGTLPGRPHAGQGAHTRTRTHTHAHTHARAHTHTHARTRTRTRTRDHACMHT